MPCPHVLLVNRTPCDDKKKVKKKEPPVYLKGFEDLYPVIRDAETYLGYGTVAAAYAVEGFSATARNTRPVLSWKKKQRATLSCVNPGLTSENSH